MATAEISLGSVQGRGNWGGTIPVLDSAMVDHDVITLSGSSQQSDFSVPAGSSGMVWVITANGGGLRVMFGANPTAVAAEGGGWLILSGLTQYFVATPGDKAAVITQA